MHAYFKLKLKLACKYEKTFLDCVVSVYCRLTNLNSLHDAFKLFTRNTPLLSVYFFCYHKRLTSPRPQDRTRHGV